ncbi:MAG: hypothetical protein ACPLQP_06065 [Moorellaceae bacterium]
MKTIYVLLDKLKEEKTPEALRDLLANLPSETDREFEVLLTRVAQIQGIDGLFYQILEEALKEGNEVDERYRKIAYACFYGLNIYYRHARDITKVGKLIEQYQELFGGHPTFPHVLSLYYRSTGKQQDSYRALHYARQAANAVRNHAGILHSLAEILINLIDEGVLERESNLAEAEAAINEALHLDPDYPKFYSTKSQLLALKGSFAEAKELVQRAIDMEDSGAFDYSIRLNGYYYLLAKIQLMEFSKKVEEKLSYATDYIAQARRETEEQLKQFRNESLQFLGLFAAIVSFTVGSIQFIAKQPFEQGILLLLVFSGSLLCIYAGLSIMLYGKSGWYRIIAILLLAAVLILGPVLALRGVFIG